MNIDQLIPTHNRLRDLSSFYYFKDRFNNTKQFDCDPIIVIQTEDRKLYLWDSHHRCAAWASVGGQIIPEDKVIIKYYTTKQINEVNLYERYVTPFDILTECRLPDFSFFKEMCIKMITNKDCDTEKITEYIKNNRKYYIEPRIAISIKHVLELSGLT